jgi:predicted enzyme related to lactoylglutathione lyase
MTMAQTTATTMRLGSLVLGSTDPERLSAWYRAAFAPSSEAGGVLELSSGRLIFDRRDDLEPAPREAGRILMNLDVDDIRAAEAHLRSLDVEWIRPVEPFPAGMIATLKDIDGNYVQIVEFSGEAHGG